MAVIHAILHEDACRSGCCTGFYFTNREAGISVALSLTPQSDLEGYMPQGPRWTLQLRERLNELARRSYGGVAWRGHDVFEVILFL